MPPKGTRPPVMPVPAPATVTGVPLAIASPEPREFGLIRGHVNAIRMAAKSRGVFQIRGIQSDLQNHRHDQGTALRLLVQDSASDRCGFSPASRPNRVRSSALDVSSVAPPPAGFLQESQLSSI